MYIYMHTETPSCPLLLVGRAATSIFLAEVKANNKKINQYIYIYINIDIYIYI